MQERIGELCGQFKLPTVGAQSVARFTAAGHGDALATFLEVLEQEAEDRRHRRINRLRRESRLPSGKTWCQGRSKNVPLRCRRPAKSNCLVCQEVATVGFQALPVFAMLLSTVSSFRIQAVRASFLGFPAARRRW